MFLPKRDPNLFLTFHWIQWSILLSLLPRLVVPWVNHAMSVFGMMSNIVALYKTFPDNNRAGSVLLFYKLDESGEAVDRQMSSSNQGK